MTTQWLSIVDFARHYNISDMTVRRRIKTGKLQAILREGKYYIPSGEGMMIEEEPQRPSSPAPVLSGTAIGSRLDSERLITLAAAASAPPPSPSPASSAGDQQASLVEFCNAALAKFNRLEEQLKVQMQQVVTALEEKVKRLEAALELSKEREAKSRQEVKDLQLLLQMIENPS